MSMITEQVKQLREHYKSCDLAGDYITRDILKRAADTIEQLAAKVREDNVYQKAFKDIKAEIESVQINGQIDNHTAFIRSGEQVKNMALEIIDSYDPRRSRNEQY